jgi:hypothetical protein
MYGSTVLLLDLGHFLSFLILYTVGRTPWTGDQPVARPVPTHRTPQTRNKRTDIHALSGIRTHEPSVRATEDSSCLRPRGHCDRQLNITKLRRVRYYAISRWIQVTSPYPDCIRHILILSSYIFLGPTPGFLNRNLYTWFMVRMHAAWSIHPALGLMASIIIVLRLHVWSTSLCLHPPDSWCAPDKECKDDGRLVGDAVYS